jgi:cytoskeletal protein CcmA (bactofilin family)
MKMKSEINGNLSGFLDRDTAVKGDLHFEETLRIDGKFEGTIRSGKNLVVGETADVNADIEVTALYVSGKLSGSARVSGRIELTSTAKVQSDLVTSILVVEEGAVFEGHCSMSKDKVSGPRQVEPPITEMKKFQYSR